MQLTPYITTRFSPYLQSRYLEFRQAMYSCLIGTQRLQQNDAILEQGQTVNQLFIVPAGRVSMHISAINGRRFQLGELECSYQIFGEMELFTKTLCQWSVIAGETLEIDVLDARKVEQLLIEQPQYTLFFATALAVDYQDSLDIYTNRLLHPITYNIAYDLLHHKDNTQMLGRFNRIDQEAERFGTSSRVYRRALKTLIEQGLVTKQKNGELIIINREGLKQYLDELE
ncbi:Crp/Fnr family transcriptional regulator [Photobacterium damselae]|uniref:Crp/Fnr family transcriptional regulator n=1 Tax=Photobacterium damselae TaxID=38293 RepID=UPI0040683EF2